MSDEAAASARSDGIVVATAGWSIPAQDREVVTATGTLLERYASRLDGVEINSSFYRPHRTATYARWAASVPRHFRFAVKVPRAVTHERRLEDCEELIDRFADEIAGLGDKRGPLLVQLPPSLAFVAGLAARFMAALAARTGAAIVCEPRHRSWFTPEADVLLADLRVARVAADPSIATGSDQPGGWCGYSYWRLHGAPEIYTSDYGAPALETLARRLRAAGVPSWCVFDNTKVGHAFGNALTFDRLLDRAGAPARC